MSFLRKYRYLSAIITSLVFFIGFFIWFTQQQGGAGLEGLGTIIFAPLFLLLLVIIVIVPGASVYQILKPINPEEKIIANTITSNTHHIFRWIYLLLFIILGIFAYYSISHQQQIGNLIDRLN